MSAAWVPVSVHGCRVGDVSTCAGLPCRRHECLCMVDVSAAWVPVSVHGCPRHDYNVTYLISLVDQHKKLLSFQLHYNCREAVIYDRHNLLKNHYGNYTKTFIILITENDIFVETDVEDPFNTISSFCRFKERCLWFIYNFMVRCYEKFAI